MALLSGTVVPADRIGNVIRALPPACTSSTKRYDAAAMYTPERNIETIPCWATGQPKPDGDGESESIA